MASGLQMNRLATSYSADDVSEWNRGAGWRRMWGEMRRENPYLVFIITIGVVVGLAVEADTDIWLVRVLKDEQAHNVLVALGFRKEDGDRRVLVSTP